jgi:hypothetical protein
MVLCISVRSRTLRGTNGGGGGRRKGRWKWRKMDAEVDVKVVREVY